MREIKFRAWDRELNRMLNVAKLDFEDLVKENQRLTERLGISPQGDDKIDELEMAMDFARSEVARLKSTLSKIYKIAFSNRADCDSINEIKEIIFKNKAIGR